MCVVHRCVPFLRGLQHLGSLTPDLDTVNRSESVSDVCGVPLVFIRSVRHVRVQHESQGVHLTRREIEGRIVVLIHGLSPYVLCMT